MKISKWHVDYKDSQYWVYSKKSVDKKTGKEFPTDTGYFNTFAGALREVRHQMIGSKVGQNKEDNLEVVLKQIVNIDKYIVEQLEKMPEQINGLIKSINNGSNGKL